MSLFERTLPLRRGLGALRRRARSLLVLLGVSRVAVYLTAALVCLFAADYGLRLPLVVRRVALVLVAIGLLAVLVRRLLRPLLRPLDDRMLAARVEAAHPELEDRLSSSLAFGESGNDPDNEDSPELMRHVVDETVAMTGGIRFLGVARSRSTARWGLGGAVLVLLATVGALAEPMLAGIFFDRAILLRDVSWPRRTTLQVVDMEPGVPRRVTLGRETTVQVRALGSAPDRVELAYWERDNPSRVVERVDLSPSAEDPTLFMLSLYVHASYEFTVTGGDDDRARVYTIEALTPPTVLAVEMECVYPAYLEQPPATLRGGDQRVPEGTKVRLGVRTNMALKKATILVGADPPRPLERVEEHLHAVDLVANEDLRYSIRLVGENGEENDPGVDSYVLRVVRDHAPIVRIHTPSARDERLAGGVVLVHFTARDDHRIAGARFHYQVADGAERVVALGESGGDALRLLQAEGVEPDYLVALVAIDLARLRKDDGAPLEGGDVLTYRVEADDSAGQTHQLKTAQRLEIVAEEQLNHLIDARQQDLRETLMRAAERLAAAAVEEDVLPRDDPDEFRRWAGRSQALQARLIDSLDSLSRQVQHLLNLYVFNRLSDPSAVDQLLPYYERHLLAGASRSGAPFQGTLYRTVWTAGQEKAIRVGGALSKLIEMADLADRLAADHGPAAYRALGAAGRRGATPEIVAAAFQDAAREQGEVRRGLQRLAELMREWQSFEGVVRGLKGLRDTESNIVRQLEDIQSEENK